MSALHFICAVLRCFHFVEAFASGIKLNSAKKLKKIMNDNETNSPYMPYVEALALRGHSPTIDLMDVRVVLEMIRLR